MSFLKLFSFLGLACLVVLTGGCDFSDSNALPNSMLLIDIHGDAEEVKSFSGNFINKGYEFTGASMQSEKRAHTGKYSVELQKGNEFGLGIKIDSVAKGSYAEVSVWRYSSTGRGVLHVSSDKVGDLYYLEGKTLEADSSGWKKIVINVPIDQEIDRLVIACFNPNETPVYFDDLRVRIYKSRPVRHEVENEFSVHISDSNYQRLLGYRAKALEQKVISKELKKYVKAMVVFKGDSIPVKMRFKGDWTDHLKGDKWSFRIKVGDGFSVNGLKSFSIQSPVTRGFMNEWFMHKVFDDLGLLTTSYDFIPVSLNGNNLGIYAIEEHFDKQLIESRSRREGPILKFDEEGFWEKNLIAETDKIAYSIPFYEASAILPFKRKRTFKNETLKNEYLIAKDLFYQYKNHSAPIENIFDVEALAKYHALLDLGAVLHGQGWHNQRIYYNPITSRLEPIAYDLFTDDVVLVEREAILGRVYDEEDDYNVNDFLNLSVFNQKSFQVAYLEQLKSFSSTSFLKRQYEDLKPEIDSLNKLLGEEFAGYQFELTPFESKAQQIREELPQFENEVNEGAKKFKLRTENYDDLINTAMYYEETGLKVYTSKMEEHTSHLQLVNFHGGPVKVIGYGNSKNVDTIILLDTPVLLDAFETKEKIKALEVTEKVSRVFFQLPAFGDSIFVKKVVKWSYPSVSNPRMELENRIPFSSPHYTVSNSEVIFNKNVILTDIVFIPKGYVVKIAPGTKMIFDSNGGILSYSPIQALGTKQQPILVTGINKNNNGFQVLTQNDSSVFTHVTFSGMSTLNYKGWNLTGGVTVYQGKVKMDYCTFTKNHCEDALNLVNSSFHLSNSLISHTFSDGFDGDFCTGIVSNTKVDKPGNDGLDFSGSVVEIENCEVISPGDKAVSGGEASNVSITGGQIRGAKLGVVSKDQSVVNVEDTEFHFCQHPFAVFQKKDESGPAFLETKNHSLFESTDDFLIGPGCSILDNEELLNEVNIKSVQELYAL